MATLDRHWTWYCHVVGCSRPTADSEHRYCIFHGPVYPIHKVPKNMICKHKYGETGGVMSRLECMEEAMPGGDYCTRHSGAEHSYKPPKQTRSTLVWRKKRRLSL